MMAPVLDTHTWIWWLLSDPRMGSAEQRVLDELPSWERPILPDISLWEVAMLVAGGRLALDDDLEDWLRVAASPATVQLARLSPEVVVTMNRLPSDFHRDPADRLIVSTALALRRPLFTCDQKIIDSKVVPIWSAEDAR